MRRRKSPVPALRPRGRAQRLSTDHQQERPDHREHDHGRRWLRISGDPAHRKAGGDRWHFVGGAILLRSGLEPGAGRQAIEIPTRRDLGLTRRVAAKRFARVDWIFAQQESIAGRVRIRSMAVARSSRVLRMAAQRDHRKRQPQGDPRLQPRTTELPRYTDHGRQVTTARAAKAAWPPSFAQLTADDAAHAGRAQGGRLAGYGSGAEGARRSVSKERGASARGCIGRAQLTHSARALSDRAIRKPAAEVVYLTFSICSHARRAA